MDGSVGILILLSPPVSAVADSGTKRSEHVPVRGREVVDQRRAQGGEANRNAGVRRGIGFAISLRQTPITLG